MRESDSVERYTADLWQQHASYIRKLCFFKLQNRPEEAEDCLQEVFAALVQTLNRGVVLQNPRAWLTKTANNKIKDVYAKEQEESCVCSYNDAVFDENELACDTIAIKRADAVEAEKYIFKVLTADERQLLTDKYDLHMSGAEIAQKYGISEQAVYKRLSRLKKKVQTLIFNYLYE